MRGRGGRDTIVHGRVVWRSQATTGAGGRTFTERRVVTQCRGSVRGRYRFQSRRSSQCALVAHVSFPSGSKDRDQSRNGTAAKCEQGGAARRPRPGGRVSFGTQPRAPRVQMGGDVVWRGTRGDAKSLVVSRFARIGSAGSFLSRVAGCVFSFVCVVCVFMGARHPNAVCDVCFSLQRRGVSLARRKGVLVWYWCGHSEGKRNTRVWCGERGCAGCPSLCPDTAQRRADGSCSMDGRWTGDDAARASHGARVGGGRTLTHHAAHQFPAPGF